MAQARQASMDATPNSPWREEFRQLIRSVSSAFLFGVPLLYTMEVWWVGMISPLWKLFLFLVFAFVLNVFMGFFAGCLDQKSFRYAVYEAVEAVAIGTVVAFVFLLVLNEISFTQPFPSVLGKVLAMVVPFSIGAFLSDILFPFVSGRRGDRNPEEEAQEAREEPLKATMEDIGATLAGGIFVGFPIAPTEEIPMLATQMTYWHELALVILSLLVSYVIVFASSIGPQEVPPKDLPFLQRPLTETALAYGVSLLLSFLLLYLFHRISPDDSLPFIVSQVLVMSFPVTIGGAAGRLAA